MVVNKCKALARVLEKDYVNNWIQENWTKKGIKTVENTGSNSQCLKQLRDIHVKFPYAGGGRKRRRTKKRTKRRRKRTKRRKKRKTRRKGKKSRRRRK